MVKYVKFIFHNYYGHTLASAVTVDAFFKDTLGEIRAFSISIFRRWMTYGEPDQGYYSGDRRRYQRIGKVAEHSEQFHKEDPEPASGCK